MFKGKRNYSLGCQPEHKAIQALLDCSDNTIKAKNFSKTLRIEDDSICPWLGNLMKKPLLQNKNNSVFIKTHKSFSKTYHKYKGKKSRQICNKTLLSTPKAKIIPEQLENYNYMSSNVINLTRQLEIIHHRKKNNYMNNYIRQQLYLRMKTT